MDLPTVQQVDIKKKAIDNALNYRFSSVDVDKILASKGKFLNCPQNYAMKKTKLRKERDTAAANGDDETVADLDFQLEELEKRAEELDRKREGSLSKVKGINSRNRRNNVTRAEMGIKEEACRKAKEEADVLDPFTRRKTVPVMFQTSKVEKKVESTLIDHLSQKKATKEENKIGIKKISSIEAEQKIGTS